MMSSPNCLLLSLKANFVPSTLHKVIHLIAQQLLSSLLSPTQGHDLTEGGRAGI